jgi:hypothetical protein
MIAQSRNVQNDLAALLATQRLAAKGLLCSLDWLKGAWVKGEDGPASFGAV